MSFKDATDMLAAVVTHDELGDVLGVHVQSIRQARMEPDASGYRSPPAGWERVVARIARKRAAALLDLAKRLERG